MALLQGKWIGQRGVSLKGALYVREWRGKLVICKWPKKKGRKLNAKTRVQMEWFKNANLLAKYLIPQQQIIAREASSDTPLLPRDLLIAAMAGRLWSITLEGGGTIYSEASARDVSKNLDAIRVAPIVAAPPPAPPPTPTTEDGVSRLTKSGADLLLIPLNGNALPIDGTNETVPSAGVTLSAVGLAIDTDHLIYAFMSAGVMTLEASTTGHAVDAATGVEIKTGDSTRTLVGMARPITGPAWVDTPAQRFVLSWFNRRTVVARVNDTTARTTTSTTLVEISTTYRAEFLTWADEMPLVQITGVISNTTGLQWTGYKAAIDTTIISGLALGSRSGDGAPFNPVAAVASPTSIAEGYHFSTLQGMVSAGTGSYDEIFNNTSIKG